MIISVHVPKLSKMRFGAPSFAVAMLCAECARLNHALLCLPSSSATADEDKYLQILKRFDMTTVRAPPPHDTILLLNPLEFPLVNARIN